LLVLRDDVVSDSVRLTGQAWKNRHRERRYIFNDQYSPSLTLTILYLTGSIASFFTLLSLKTKAERSWGRPEA
jgi:hypothetical protein